ncbi:MAG: HD domain-containing protein [Thermodesulfovibrio sp.]|nr:HD domain-containing protein [Thermodesulfovibrio sp.]MCX7724920.1 HD domain-containing protein [Thermodesulfovibrio sp.]MDW7973154.1 HD domain-containing protein [Thermodesulfovibrio sp.]
MSTQIKEIDNYFSIKLELIPLNMKVPCDIFIQEDGELKVILKKGEHFSLEIKNSIKYKKIDTIYVNNTDKKVFQDFILEFKPKEYFNSLLDRYIINNELFYKIEKECLDPEVPVTFSLYLHDGKSLNLLLEASEETPRRVSKENFSEGDILISKKDLNLYKEYLQSLISATKSNSKILKETTKLILREIYSEPINRKNLLILGDKIDEIIEYGTLEANALKKLLIMKKLDNYSYVHAFNVMTLCVALGLKIKLNREELRLLGLASALHDIGKINISPLILSKIGKLNEKEFQIYKTHVIESVKIAEQLGVSKDVIDGIAHHHEKLNGTGYPFNLKGEQISLFGRIIAIADAYEMLTTPKPLKYPLSPYNALMILVQDKKCYDKSLLEIFIKMLGRLI